MARADARENRARILEVARTAFVADGATSMNQIAHRAGVGAGTLYRHFPTREALVLAVYQDEVDRLTGSVADLLAELQPLEALRRWITELTEAMRRKHGLGDALSSTAYQAIAEQSYGPVVAAIATLLDAGKQDGSIRPDADPGDVLQFTAALWRAPTTPEDRAPRMLALLLDGLRARDPRTQ
jgi:AcrR family transcriptional regulator